MSKTNKFVIMVIRKRKRNWIRERKKTKGVPRRMKITVKSMIIRRVRVDHYNQKKERKKKKKVDERNTKEEEKSELIKQEEHKMGTDGGGRRGRRK